ncbi:DEAD/DEAH box helicase family protein, partial [Azotobacter vinelandii]|uniref:DEAD/DEAH box helicase family protein n=1 Tax=Azotobacter vinelandii TaxID=354 RepID=UPI000774332E
MNAPFQLPSALNLNLTDFIDAFRDELLDSLNQSNPPVYTGHANAQRQAVLDTLKRKAFPAQAEVVQAVTALLLDRGEQAAIINAEMGSGKSMMAIATAAVMHAAGYRRTLVISPPHLVYKWRREILETIPDARVWVLNGPDTLGKLLKLREQIGQPYDGKQEFFVLGRVRMRMGFHWRAVCAQKRALAGQRLAACPSCGALLHNDEGEPLTVEQFHQLGADRRRSCPVCREALWTLMRPKAQTSNPRATLIKSMCQIPTLGPVRAERLVNDFGESFLAGMLADNLSEFVNLMDAQGNFVFSDRQAKRMERAMASIEFGFGEGGYQPTEFIKRALPDGFFDLLIADEAHEYKNAGSAQGQAMAVLAAKTRKTVLLTGTLMGGYADDLFFLLFRVLTQRMLEDGYRPNARGSLASAAMSFMRDHGVLKDVFTERDGSSHRTAKGKKLSVRTQKAPGFGPKGILRYVLPFTVFLKLKDIGGNVLPDYREEFVEVPMAEEQAAAYRQLAGNLTAQLRQALARRDTTLLGVVLNVLLAWPDCCFRPEVVKHPRTRDTLASVPAVFGDEELMPKEQALLE